MIKFTQDSFFPEIPEAKKRGKHYVKPKGYAGTPGSGPKGETCKTCKHYTRAGYHNRVHLKCGLVQWAHSRSNDILAGSPACQFWEAEQLPQVTA